MSIPRIKAMERDKNATVFVTAVGLGITEYKIRY